jgi:hypothetical protein
VPLAPLFLARRSTPTLDLTVPTSLSPEVRKALVSLHDEVMWLAGRPGVTPSMARAWYTHVVAERLKRHIRIFSGKVSRAAAADPAGDLRLEHHGRIQTKLTSLVKTHRELKLPNAQAFIRTLVKLENVHIVTRAENYAAMRASGDYEAAGIKLVPWAKLPKPIREDLWRRMLRGRVGNASEFAVE